MDLTALQAFVKVVQTGSFTRAAEALDTQKAHLSRVVGQLERELGVRLLARTTRALSLIEVGREVFERAVGILASVEDVRRTVQKSLDEPRGTLRLSCGVEFGMIAVTGWVNAFLARYPDMRVEADYTQRVVDLVHEGFDLAVRVGPLADSSLAARRLGNLRYGLFASGDYLARRGAPASPEGLARHALLAFSGGASPRAWRLEKSGRAVDVAVRPRLEASNVFALRDAAVAGLGIAQLPEVIAGDALRAGRLHPVLGDWSPPEVPVFAVFASARYLTPKVRSFIDLAVADMRQWAPRQADGRNA